MGDLGWCASGGELIVKCAIESTYFDLASTNLGVER
jgi:hypothetical protein